ncbi:T27 [Tupaiid betaherpesvirus 1]|uniref:T27 n=1 Tax=Tupaiid herpesvirus 1 (strain 1) TaxID=10397 RepID=Q91TS2_TUHV1|nr:T27 [Tupaiid betaherpesvirus 1]AAK57065.1 T27 [Tupaiid betaherpesvirus 1]
METAPLHARRRVVYELIRDDPPTPFGEAFIGAHLQPVEVALDSAPQSLAELRLRRKRSAARDDGPGCSSARDVVYRPIVVIQFRSSYLQNAEFATAAGKYRIRGLLLPWDTAVWGLLRRSALPSRFNPLQRLRAADLCSYLNTVAFRPEASDVARHVARTVAVGQYAVQTVFDYRNPGGLSHYLRFLCESVHALYGRLERIGDTLDDRARLLIADLLPRAVCRQLGYAYDPDDQTFIFDPQYLHASEQVLQILYDRLCDCEECQERRFTAAAAATSLRRGPKRRKRSSWAAFERRDVVLEQYRELGVLRLPCLRHLKRDQQLELCQQLRHDLCFRRRQTLTARELLLPIGVPCGHGVSDAYALYLASNLVFTLFLAQTLHAIVRIEARAYIDLLSGHADALVGALRRQASYLQHGGLGDGDGNDAGPSGGRSPSDGRKLARLTRRLRGLDFGFGGGSGSGTAFFTAFCDFLEIVEKLPDYARLSEFQVREELLVHHFYLAQVYADPSPETQAGERLVSYYVQNGDACCQDAARLRALVVDLSDRELSRAPRAEPSWAWTIEPTEIVFPPRIREVTHFEDLYVRRYWSGEVGGWMPHGEYTIEDEDRRVQHALEETARAAYPWWHDHSAYAASGRRL